MIDRIAGAQTIMVNINDRVRFRIRPDSIGLFQGNPGIEIGEVDDSGLYPSEAQLHVLIVALEGHLKPWLTPPIDTRIEFLAPVVS